MSEREITSSLRRPRTVALAMLAGSAFLTAGLPAATARSTHQRPGSTSSEPPEPSSSEAGKAPVEQRPPHSETTTGPSQSATPPAAGEGEHGDRRAKRTPAGHVQEGANSEAAAPVLTPEARRGAAVPHHGDGARGPQDSRPPAGGQREGRVGHRAHGGSSAAPGAAAGTEAASTPQAKAGPESAGSPEARRKHERSSKPKGARVEKGKAKKVESARPTTLSSEQSSPTPTSSAPDSSSPTAAVASAAAAPAPLPAAPAAGVSAPASAALATGSAASITRRLPQARPVRAARHARRTAVSRNAAPANLASSAQPAASVAAVALPGGANTAHPKPAAKHTVSSVRSSPLATTITRIVGVVPTPIRILIAALVALALAMAARSRLSARRARRAEQQRSELLEDVGLLQAALLPTTPTRLGPVGTSTAYRPAAGPGAGGDFYDVFALEDGKIAVIVGDVSGHGRKALPHTALVRFTLRAYLEAGLSPRGALQTAGTVLDSQLGGSFATVVAATYNPRERRLVYASAGHPPPIVRASRPDAEALEPITVCSSPPIGVGLPTGVRQSVVEVPGAAQICFFTDGVTEARVGEELFGAQRLGAALAELGPQASATELLEKVSRIADRRPDDMAACLLRIEGPDEAPVALAEELELSREDASSDRVERFLEACGVPSQDSAQLLRSARAAVERSGSAVLELHRGSGAPEVSMKQDNLAYLQTRHAARQAEAGMSL